MKLSNDRQVVARLKMQDINKTRYRRLIQTGCQHAHVERCPKFPETWPFGRESAIDPSTQLYEAAIYALLEECPLIPTSPLLYCRPGEYTDEGISTNPGNIRGRLLFLFDMPPDRMGDKLDLDESQLVEKPLLILLCSLPSILADQIYSYLSFLKGQKYAQH